MSEGFIKSELTGIEETYRLIALSFLNMQINALIIQLHSMTNIWTCVLCVYHTLFKYIKYEFQRYIKQL